jgi:hypothetical protein
MSFIKKDEDVCGLKTVYTPCGLQGPEGPPGPITLDTVIVSGHNIVLADILSIGPSDITVNVVNSGTFTYKIIGNKMVWFDIDLSLDVTVAAGGLLNASFNKRIDNLPVTWGDPLSAGGETLSIGDVFPGTGPTIDELISISGLTVVGSDNFDLNQLSQKLTVGAHPGLNIRISGISPGVIL